MNRTGNPGEGSADDQVDGLGLRQFKTQVVDPHGIIPDADYEAAKRGLGIKPQDEKAYRYYRYGKIIKVYLVSHINGDHSRNVEWRNGISPNAVLTAGYLSIFQGDDKNELAKGQGQHGKGGPADP